MVPSAQATTSVHSVLPRQVALQQILLRQCLARLLNTNLFVRGLYPLRRPVQRPLRLQQCVLIQVRPSQRAQHILQKALIK